MKKIISILMISVMLLGVFVGCGSKEVKEVKKEVKETKKVEEKKEVKKEDKKIVIGYSQIGGESGWRSAETTSIQETCKEDSMIELKFSDAQQKQENQIKAIRSFIAQGVDVIALSPVVESGWETVLTEAKEAGIPVVLVDRGITVDDESLYTSFIGSDFIIEGEMAANYVINKFGKDAKVNIVELQGTVGASAATDRMTGFAKVIDENAGFETIKSQTGDFTRSKGKEVMEAFLKSDGENINVVYAHNDDMALGAIQAIEEYGKKPGEDIVIVSVDGIKPAFEAIAAGKMNCTVECTPLLGPELVQAAKDLVDGKELPRWIKSNDRVFGDQDAIDELPNRKY